MTRVQPLLEVAGLRVRHRASGRAIVAGLDLAVAPGETVGVVGESGSGKSVTAKVVAGLLPDGLAAEGSVRLAGRELLGCGEGELTRIRGRRVSLLMQDPFTLLNPLVRIGAQVVEPLAHGDGPSLSAEVRREEAIRRLEEVGIRDPSVADRYPFELSGGMLQRVGLASALACDPELLIADEPTTALDATTQAEILALLERVQASRGMGLVLITHDLRVAFATCDRVSVMYAGGIVERSPAADADDEPLHPYTLGLVLSEPSIDRRVARLEAIPGSVPRADEVAGGCAFAPRCTWTQDVCRDGRPPLALVERERETACLRIGEIRPAMRARRAELEVAEAAVGRAARGEPLLVAADVRKRFRTRHGGTVEALRGVSLTVGEGESVGLVGESGSGKTTFGRIVLGLEQASSGELLVGGVPRTPIGGRAGRAARERQRMVQMVFQDPYSSLNPKRTIGATLAEALMQAPSDGRWSGSDGVRRLLERVGLPAAYARRRPALLSGGERQRVAIARAIAVGPRLVVCDEPVSALDVSVQAQILTLFRELQEDLGLSYLFISHDLSVVRQVVDRVYVLLHGEVVEDGDGDRVLGAPEHPYTQRLVASVPGALDNRRVTIQNHK